MSNDDIERQEFERVVLDIAPYSTDLTRANGGLNYSDPQVDMAWIFFRAGWQASRAALVVELPVKRSDANRQGNYAPAVCEAYDEAINDCADALRDAGISVKGEE